MRHPFEIFAQPPLFMPNPWTLSYAQGSVMVLLVQGMSGKAIASEMGVSAKTVETYLARVREKMGVENTLKAALMWDRHFREAPPVNRVPNRWYLAGPMTGIHEMNFPAFFRHAAKLRAEGLEVINPAEINADKQMAWSDCMRADLAALVTCEGIALMPDWTFSKGATLEHHVAERLGMKVRQLEMLP